VAFDGISYTVDSHIWSLLVDRVQGRTKVHENAESFRFEQLDENLQFNSNCYVLLARHESFSARLFRRLALEVQTCANSRRRDNRKLTGDLQVLLVVHAPPNN
jgi:hypothetical protein